MSDILKKIKNLLGEDSVQCDEPMSRHCTFRCGGRAKIYVTPENSRELSGVIKACSECDESFYVIGNGSNLLVRDSGYDGVIIEIGEKMGGIDIIGLNIECGAGARLAELTLAAMENDLTGLEFAYGIPGNVGGAVAMNAGAYGGEMKDVLEWAEVMDHQGNIKKLYKSELDLRYRGSVITDENLIVIRAGMKLDLGSSDMISGIQQMLMQQRRMKQPLDYPSAGSTFKRPEGYYAGKLIQDAGLAGYSIGGARVSEKHCGFIINNDNATADDVVELISYVQNVVEEKSGVRLEPEVKIIP